MKNVILSFLILLFSAIALNGQGYLGFHPIRAGIQTIDGKLYKGQLVGFENDQLYLYLSLTPFPVDSFTAPVIYIHIDDIDRMKVEGYQPPDFASTMFLGGLIGLTAGIPSNIEYGGGSLLPYIIYSSGILAGLAGGPLLIREKINQEFRFDPYMNIKPFVKTWKRYIKNTKVDITYAPVNALPYHEVAPNAEADIPISFAPELIDLPARKQALHIPRLHLKYVWFPYVYVDVLQRTGISAEFNFWKYLRVSAQFWNGEYFYWERPRIQNFPGYSVEEFYGGDLRDFQLGLTFTPRPVNRLFRHRFIPRLGAGLLLRKYDGRMSRYVTIYDTNFDTWENINRRERYKRTKPGLYAQFGFDYLFTRYFGISLDFIYKRDGGILVTDYPSTSFSPDMPFTGKRTIKSFLPFGGICLRLF